jgi:hypothetical protein
MLGFLVTRGPGWPPASECGEYKRAAGEVMGNVYCLLKPLWDEHPDLDPGSKSNHDPLDLNRQDPPASTNPAGMLPYLDEVDEALGLAVDRLLADPPTNRHRDFINNSAEQVREAITRARQAFG